MSVAVKDIMTEMPHTIGHDISVQKAKEMMQEFRCHHLPVLDGGKLVGVISDRDIKMVERIPNGTESPVEDLMTDEPVVVDRDQDINSVVKRMLKEKINSVIVSAKDGQPWGIFTSTNALEHYTSFES